MVAQLLSQLPVAENFSPSSTCCALPNRFDRHFTSNGPCRRRSTHCPDWQLSLSLSLAKGAPHKLVCPSVRLSLCLSGARAGEAHAVVWEAATSWALVARMCCALRWLARLARLARALVNGTHGRTGWRAGWPAGWLASERARACLRAKTNASRAARNCSARESGPSPLRMPAGPQPASEALLERHLLQACRLTVCLSDWPAGKSTNFVPPQLWKAATKPVGSSRRRDWNSNGGRETRARRGRRANRSVGRAARPYCRPPPRAQRPYLHTSSGC